MTDKTAPNTPALRRIIEGAAASVTSGLILWWLTAPAAQNASLAKSTQGLPSVQQVQPTLTAQPAAAIPPAGFEGSGTEEHEVTPWAAAPAASTVPLPEYPASEAVGSQSSIQASFSPQPIPAPATAKPVGSILLYEDFSRFREGDITDWGREVAVGTGQDRRKWLVPVVDGTHPVGRNMALPSEFNLECRYFAGASTITRGLLGWWKEPLGSRITFINDQGARFTIDWVISCDSDTTRLNPIGSSSICARKYFHSIKLPGASASEVSLTQPTGTLRITRDGAYLSVFLDSQSVASGAATTLGHVVGFEINAVKAKTGTLSLTDFKISR